MRDKHFSVLDLLDLYELEREVFLHMARHGPADVNALSEATGRRRHEIGQALTALAEKGRIRVAADGQADVRLGRIQPRTTLPVLLEPASPATDRLYTEQEIAMLRTAVPMLQFARARLSTFSDHGPSHALRVKSFATQLGYVLGLTSAERHLLRAGALFHDIGNVVERSRHHLISQETVEKLATIGKLPFIPKEAELVGLICRWHRREYEPERLDVLRGEQIRTGMLASILRVADAMDLDYRRSDHSRKFKEILALFFPKELSYWMPLEETFGVRIRCAPTVDLQIFTEGEAGDNILIGMLREDLDSTPLDWSITDFPVTGPATAQAKPSTWAGHALLVFPFEAHNLVMAALSRKQLNAAGYGVECLCYPDTDDAPAWLWIKTLPNINPNDFDRLVVIGDRPDAAVVDDLRQTMGRWRSAGKGVTWLNRYEANWSYLPQLLRSGVEVVLGGDWAYFWGDTVSEQDLAWARVAALCTRDPTMAAVVATPEEQALAHGLLAAILEGLEKPPHDTASWLAQAEPILTGIADDDRGVFIHQAERFSERYGRATSAYHVQGRVLIFDQAPGTIPAANYWAMERAIEKEGRKLERGICFKMPYALAAWPVADGQVELLAMNHWREEEAIPIRLRYPTDLGPLPYGHESTVRVRMPAEQAPAVVEALVAACNGSEE
jgi:hypothetical protein